jgi:hypothetical protein
MQTYSYTRDEVRILSALGLEWHFLDFWEMGFENSIIGK